VNIDRKAAHDRLVEQWVAARESITVGEGVALALRRHRRSLKLSQRGYAARRGWSKSHQARLESATPALKLADVLAALEGTGYHLALHHDRDDREVDPVEWAPTELVARFRDGRRFPAAVNPERAWTAPSWFYTRHPEAKTPPDWTWHRGR
jgi:transcriptional regulator with XRE-family HTH domain